MGRDDVVVVLSVVEEGPGMGILDRLMARLSGNAEQPARGGREAEATTERNVGGREAAAPVPPELPLDDDGNNARNLGG